jgi:predicted ATPase
LLESPITDPDWATVLLIGTYRDNEVSSSHPLMRTLAAIRNDGARVHEILLAPLGLDDLERLVADALHCGSDSAGPLTLIVQEKTGGNPFSAIQFFMALVEEGLVWFARRSMTSNAAPTTRIGNRLRTQHARSPLRRTALPLRVSDVVRHRRL